MEKSMNMNMQMKKEKYNLHTGLNINHKKSKRYPFAETREIEQELIEILKQADIPVTYAGGIGSMEDLEQIRRTGNGKVDFTSVDVLFPLPPNVYSTVPASSPVCLVYSFLAK